MIKPYKIPAPRIWVTDQAPIFYGGRIIRIKPSIIFEEKSDYSTKKKNNRYGSEQAYRDAIEKTARIVESALLSRDNNRGNDTVREQPGETFGKRNSGYGIGINSSDSGSLGSRHRQATVIKALIVK